MVQTLLSCLGPSPAFEGKARGDRAREEARGGGNHGAPGDAALPEHNFHLAYACERCHAPCTKKAFATCVCSCCQWRILVKLATVSKRHVSTD